MKLVSLHADRSPHRTWPDAQTTSEPWAFAIFPNAPVVEANGASWSSAYPVVLLFWPERYYQVCVLLKEETTEYYCNVISPVSYDAAGESVLFCDLDLDVVVTADAVKVLDEDEFEARKAEYPDAWRNGAERAKSVLVELANARKGPFSPATAERWRAYFRLHM